MKKIYFTSESVTEGHPDKICDQISDAILDEIYSKDKDARVACEVAITTGLVLVMGEITTNCYVDIPKVVRKTISDIGYNSSDMGFDANTCGVITSVDEQSGDIALGVDNSFEKKTGKDKDYSEGAGDQGLMFGFACNETDEYMPLPISLAHKLTKKLTDVRKNNTLKYLRPDGKSQVTVEYIDDKPVRIDAVVVSSQHSEEIDYETLCNDIKREVIDAILPKNLVDENTKFYINPTGRFVKGGPCADSGLTGRKIIVDTYGGYSRHGGGAFSGKDATKVDRSASYMARYIAKNIVASGLASKCEVGLSYAIGVSTPISVLIDTFGTGVIDDNKISDIAMKTFDLRVGAIIDKLNLKQPIYNQVAKYGHFGRNDLDLPWEKLDKVDELKKYL